MTVKWSLIVRIDNTVQLSEGEMTNVLSFATEVTKIMWTIERIWNWLQCIRDYN